MYSSIDKSCEVQKTKSYQGCSSFFEKPIVKSVTSTFLSGLAFISVGTAFICTHIFIELVFLTLDLPWIVYLIAGIGSIITSIGFVIAARVMGASLTRLKQDLVDSIDETNVHTFTVLSALAVILTIAFIGSLYFFPITPPSLALLVYFVVFANAGSLGLITAAICLRASLSRLYYDAKVDNEAAIPSSGPQK